MSTAACTAFQETFTAAGLVTIPGVATLANSADALKMFSAETLPPAAMKAGAPGFGLRSALYRPGANADEVDENPRLFADSLLLEIEPRRVPS